MPSVKDVGDLIAQREMEFRYHNGNIVKAALKIGHPFEYDNDYGWCCPYEIQIDKKKIVRGIFGIDSLQALGLALKSLPTEIAYWERNKDGAFYFLDELGAGVDS